jgi:phospholipase/lecithinase/hemolysin
MRVRTTASLAAAAILAVGSPSIPSAAQSPFSRIVVFGQSLSDPGNAFALRGGTNTPPDYILDPLLVPGAPYARGGHHFSNGATWVEQFARSLGLAGSVRPAYQSSSDATNFAVAGARARDDGSNVNLPDQVDAFLQQTGGAAPPDALYVIEFGANDIRDALVAYLVGGPPAAGAVLTAANISIAQAINRLHGAGARRFLVWRAPNVGLTPAIGILNRTSPGVIQLATGLTQLFNQGLDGVVALWVPVLPGIRIDSLDAWRVLNELVADPHHFGLTDVTSPCITPYVPPFTCGTPDEFLFWDGIHPTKAVHDIIALEAATVLR